MVKLTEITDDHFEEKLVGAENDDEDYYTDTDSSITESDTESVLDDGGIQEETLYERLTALKDVISPKHRAAIFRTWKSSFDFLSGGVLLSGKTLWVLSTSALLLGVPYVLAFTEEQQIIEMERDVKVQQQMNDVMTPGAASMFTQQASEETGKK